MDFATSGRATPRDQGGNDTQGFTMKQSVLAPSHVRILFSDGHSSYRTRRTGEYCRASVRCSIIGPGVAE